VLVDDNWDRLRLPALDDLVLHRRAVECDEPPETVPLLVFEKELADHRPRIVPAPAVGHSGGLPDSSATSLFWPLENQLAPLLLVRPLPTDVRGAFA